MSFSLSRGLIIARREYLSTIRRKAFVFSLLLTPMVFGLVTAIQVLTATDEAKQALKIGSIAVVDSAGLLGSASHTLETEVVNKDDPTRRLKVKAEPKRVPTTIEFFPDQASALTALKSGRVSQVLVVPPDYLSSGQLRRFKLSNNLFSSSDERAVGRWLARSLVANAVDSVRADRVSRPLSGIQLFTPTKSGGYELHDESREMIDFFVPFGMGLLLSIAIVTGGQYLLQGVSEEKESRILESLLCTVTSEELMFGKLVGLGGAGLTLVTAWTLMGAYFVAPLAMAGKLHMSPLLLAFGVLYFMLGYLFYASLMTGIGAIATNLREANQMAILFTFANFVPFYMLPKIIGHPDSGLAVAMSLFPLTAPTSMLMRLAATDVGVPAWQIGVSLALLAGAAWLAVVISARVFRIGLLMYGKSPSLPEIIRWARQG
jgi:ABC-2 type transport system permease protein